MHAWGQEEKVSSFKGHGSAMEGYYPHELILRYEVCQMKGTLIGFSELTLEKSYEFGLLRKYFVLHEQSAVKNSFRIYV